MKLKRISLSSAKLMLGIILFFPLTAFAHLIEITATTPFPATIAATTLTIASFTVTNISTIPITAVDQSDFPDQSGLSVLLSTCGNLMNPGQSCIIQLSLNALKVGHQVKTELKIWAKPSADAVKYPINFSVTSGLPNITLVPVSSNPLPALRDPIIAENSGKWLIVSGSLGSIHDFDNNFNTDIYVYDPNTMQLHSVIISTSDLRTDVKNQLASSMPEVLQDGDTLYIIGGFYNIPSTTSFTTLNTITSINVPGMIQAVINGDLTLDQYVNTNTNINEFYVVGGQLGKIDNDFYLTYGQRCEGPYCFASQVYTKSIFKFTTDPTLSTITIVDSATGTDLNGWRRRDYTLLPVINNDAEALLALGGPFTPGSDAYVWTNAILFNSELQSTNSFLNQQGNQYLASHLPMYSANKKMNYSATFGGLSNLYWGQNELVYDNSTPYGNILDLISADNSGNAREYVNLSPLCSGQPLASCLYMGLGAQFIQVNNYYDSRGILQLDQLPQNSPTLVGYIYAGLISNDQNIFPPPTVSAPTNQIYEVYVVPAGSSGTSWQDVTNAFCPAPEAISCT